DRDLVFDLLPDIAGQLRGGVGGFTLNPLFLGDREADRFAAVLEVALFTAVAVPAVDAFAAAAATAAVAVPAVATVAAATAIPPPGERCRGGRRQRQGQGGEHADQSCDNPEPTRPEWEIPLMSEFDIWLSTRLGARKHGLLLRTAGPVEGPSEVNRGLVSANP